MINLQVALSFDGEKAIDKLGELQRNSLSYKFRIDSEFVVRSDGVGNSQIFLCQFSSDEIVHYSNCIGDSSEDDHFWGGVLKFSLKNAEFGFERDEKLIDGSINIDRVVSSSSAAEDFSLKNVVFVDLFDDIWQVN